ncbi:hypothetical protein BGP_2423 [Beggiatoa sp. PS]|nr:hypothetical protein BGP_2423 [Beggiatoa sp. PS]
MFTKCLATRDYSPSIGLLRFDDPNIFGSIWTTSVDTHYLSYKEVFEWQKRLTQVGRSRYMENGVVLHVGQ